jgi:hypothetical protein
VDIHPKTLVHPYPRPRKPHTVSQLCVWTYVADLEPPSTQSPFARPGCSPRPGELPESSRKTLLFLLRSYGLMRQANCLPSPRSSLVRRVFAGCHQSLLGVGPSRHYLCNPCVGAWTHTPPCLPGAHAHFFPGSNGLTPRATRSAHETIPAMRFPQGAVFRGYSHSFTFRLLHSLGLQIAPTAKQDARGGQAVYTTHRLEGYPIQDVASLRVRLGQLTRRDLHPLDCSLVGCSCPHPALLQNLRPSHSACLPTSGDLIQPQRLV